MNIEHENTARALKDEPLLATTPWRCRFMLHVWTKWTTPVTLKRGIYLHTEQYRQCSCCGKAQIYHLMKN